ncbi:MAG: glycosyltransferase, partial [Ornithinimicrobium sp.]
MRVALLGPTRNPVAEPFAGGQESHVATLCRALRSLGHHITLYASTGSDSTLCDELVEHPHPPLLSSVAALDPQLPEPTFLADQYAYFAVVADLMARREHIDVVHNSSLHHLPLVAARAVGRPLVTTLHTPPFPWMEVGVALADPRSLFVAVSESLAAQWQTLKPRPTVVYNGVCAASFSLGNGGEDLVWVGRLVADKGADRAIDAAQRAGRRLRLVGPRSDPDWFEARVRPRLGPDVVYEGHLDHGETAQVVGSAVALLATPRWAEPFGLVCVEAALTGTPVVALRRGGLAEVVEPGLG